MRLTRFGVWVVLAAVFSLFGAITSGNNLIYLANGMILAVLFVATAAGRRNLSGLTVRVAVPDQVFQYADFALALTIENAKSRSSHQISLAGFGTPHAAARIKGRTSAKWAPVLRLPHRGFNLVSGLWLTSEFPFGLFRRRTRLDPVEVLAYPHIREWSSPSTSLTVRLEHKPLPRRGVGDEFHGLRTYTEGEDSRLINWKLTAKTGTPLVTEYAQPIGTRVTIAVAGASGPDTERLISEAASAARFHIDSGAEVRLETDEGAMDFGKGLLHLETILRTLALLGPGKERKTAGAGAAVFGVHPPQAAPPRAPGFAYATLAVALASLLLIEELNPLIVLLLAPAIPLGRWFDRKKFYPVPRLLFEILTVLYLAYFLVVDLRRSGAQLAVTHLVLYIFVHLLFNPKKDHQVRQLFLTSFLMFFLATGLAVSLWYFICLLAYFLAAGAWSNSERDPVPAAPGRPAWAASLVLLILLSFGLASTSFMFMPRLYSARMQRFLAAMGLSRFQLNQRSFSGLTERMELGYMGPLLKNSARAMRIGFPDSGPDFEPPPFVRVRGGAFDAFDGRRWRKTRAEISYRSAGRLIATRHAQAWMRREDGIIASPRYDPGRPAVTTEYMIFPLLNTALVFGIGEISAIEAGMSSAFFDFTDTVAFPSAYIEGIRYRIRSQSPAPTFYAVIEDYDRILKDKFLGIPGAKERYTQLAQEFAGGAFEPLAKARALESHLKNRFAYSLSAAAGRQTLDEFLFRNREGNCEYFATALCILLRSIEIPTRLIIGFLGEEWNAYGRFFDIRQSDAHAWVEAYFPGRGWLTFDPTPAGLSLRGAPGLFARLWGKIDQVFQALQFRWYRYVVGFDTDTRKNLIYNLSLHLSPHLLKLLIGLALSVAAVVVLLVFKPWRRTKKTQGSAPPADSFYLQVVARLAKAGFRRKPWQTGLEFAEDLARCVPALHSLPDLTEFHYRIRFAGRTLTETDRRAVLALAREVMDAADAAGKKSCQHKANSL